MVSNAQHTWRSRKTELVMLMRNIEKPHENAEEDKNTLKRQGREEDWSQSSNPLIIDDSKFKFT